MGAIVGGILIKSDKKGLAVIFWIGTGLKLGFAAVGLFGGKGIGIKGRMATVCRVRHSYGVQA